MTTSTVSPKDAARLEIESLLESNAERVNRNRRAVVASLDEEARLKSERMRLLTLYRRLGGDPEPYEMEGAEVAS